MDKRKKVSLHESYTLMEETSKSKEPVMIIQTRDDSSLNAGGGSEGGEEKFRA